MFFIMISVKSEMEANRAGMPPSVMGLWANEYVVTSAVTEEHDNWKFYFRNSPPGVATDL